MSLQARLDAFKADFEAGKPPYNVPPSVIATMRRATAELIASGLAERALKVGDRAPAFELKDANGAVVRSSEFLERGPLVVSFYRGVWCPYCDMELQALQAALPEFQRLGASLLPSHRRPRLTAANRRATTAWRFRFSAIRTTPSPRRFGLRFELPNYLVALYKNLKNDLPGFNGDSSWTLPMPARFVIGADGALRYAEVNPDYTKRPEPEAMLPALRDAATRRAA